MPWETNRLLEKKHCPLFRLRMQPLINYYKLLTSLVISFQTNRITVRKLLSPPRGEEERGATLPQDAAIDASCFQNVCKRLKCQHCYESFSDEEFVEASDLLRKESRKKSRPTTRGRGRPKEKKCCLNAEIR